MFRKILIATDNSPLMDNIIRYTALLFPQAEFHVLSVIDTSKGNVPLSSLVRSALEGLAREAVENAAKILAEMGLEAIKATPAGRPSTEILNYIARNQIGLLVMATHSKSGTQALHIGRCCTRILEHSRCPILLFNKPAKLERPKRILNPTSGSKYSHQGSLLAASLANNLGASLTVLFFGRLSAAEEEIAYVEGLAQALKVPLTKEVCTGDPERCIIERAREHDLIVGSRGRRGLAYKLRFLIPPLALGRLEREVIAESAIPFIMGIP
jgi:nucleotide-binding universal stress UspA family protein